MPTALPARVPIERPVSGLERQWLVGGRLAPPFALQIALDLDPTGWTGWDLLRWQAALDTVAAASPGVRVRLVGALGWSRWRADGPAPAVRVVDGRGWSGRDPRGAPFLTDPLDPARGPVCELLLVDGDPPRVVVRILHAVADGRGAWSVVEDLWSALRGEAPPARTAGPPIDTELARAAGGPRLSDPAMDAAPLLPARGPIDARSTWASVTVPGRQRNLVPRLAVALAAAAGVQRRVRIGVPVDLRRHAPDLSSTANLTGIAALELDDDLRAADPAAAVRARLDAALATRAECARVLSGEGARHLPLWLLTALGRRLVGRTAATGRVRTSATLSTLGRVDLQRLTAPGARVTRVVWVPPGSPVNPLLVVTTGTDAAAEIAAAAPLAMGGDGRLAALLADVAARLTAQG